METSIDLIIRQILFDRIHDLEVYLNADVVMYYGEIFDTVDSVFKKTIENLKTDDISYDKIYVILTTPGGSLNPVSRMVTVLRHFYQEVNFIIPNYAYSAGTIFCMSGDNILMNYFSVLGPIDPQVQNKEGRMVAALGYLDKVNELIDKARNNTISQAEFLILKDFDLAELKTYEQARELATEYIQEWLVSYKFKDWNIHSDGSAVTEKDKKDRAKNIANILSDNNKWHSHTHTITMDDLLQMGLKIINYENDIVFKNKFDSYYNVLEDFISKTQKNILIHTRKDLK